MTLYKVLFIDGTSFETDDPRDLPPNEFIERCDAKREAASKKAELDAKICRAEQDLYCAIAWSLCDGRSWPR